MERPVVYDATAHSGERRACVSPADLALGRHFAAKDSPLVRAIEFDEHGFAENSPPSLAQRLAKTDAAAAARNRRAYQATKAWLLCERIGPGAPPPRETAAGLRLPAFWRAGRPPEIAKGALFLKAAVDGWGAAPLERWLAQRPDLIPVAFLRALWEFDFPEYASVARSQALARDLRALARRAKVIVVPDRAAAANLESAVRQEGGRALVRVEAQPSRLAGSAAAGLDADLAAVPYVLAAGRLEARANTLLLLQIWRDLVASGKRAPKLILAGARGVQVDQIAPMLDWAESIRPYVHEASGLDSSALRRLIVHARAVLAPAFAERDASLLRDVQTLGTTVIASDIPIHRQALQPHAHLLDPLDGLAWANAVLKAAQAEPRATPDEARLPDWSAWLERALAFASSL